MTTVLILGGSGRIGQAIAQDILRWTAAAVTLTSRRSPDALATALQPRMLGQAAQNEGDHRVHYLQLDLSNTTAIKEAIAAHDVVIDCAGPFHQRTVAVLEHCIAARVSYLDVSDCVPFTRRALALHETAAAAGVTAIINTGVFPGISNGMASMGMERWRQQYQTEPHTIRLLYAVAGSGGAGLTIMKTTFLGLLQSFPAWIEGQWQVREPYSDRQVVQFPAPLGKTGVYWYEVPETLTLAQSFPVQTVITKFGSVPDFYNILTWIVARWFPSRWLTQPQFLQELAQVSYRMTQISDRFSGTGIAMIADVTGTDHDGADQCCRVTMSHPDTAIAAGAGTGALVQLILDHQLSVSGVHPVEAVVSAGSFHALMQQRNIDILVDVAVDSDAEGREG